jgi:hypothetical protein
MRPWSVSKVSTQRFAEGTEVVSFLSMRDGAICREDKPCVDAAEPEAPSENLLGWWKWTVKNTPPTQRELNERLEKLLFSTRESSAEYKEALVWLICLYLTRKKLLRQFGSTFTHAKSGQTFTPNPDAIDAGAMENALSELLNAIS